jgi:DNA-binding MarR family transcriptional regulator
MGTNGKTATETEMRTWARFVAAHSSITRELEGQMLARHGLTLSDYDALVQLAEDGPMRNVELARRVYLTRSGITRLVEGLEKQGLVDRCQCAADRRGTLVELTGAGRERVAEASKTHVGGVREMFLERMGRDERKAFDELLARMPGTACDKACAYPQEVGHRP